MPRAYSEDIRWRAIWLIEIIGLDVEEVSFYLQLSRKTIFRYIDKFRTTGNICPDMIGRPYSSIALHPHEEFVIIELVLQHPEKTELLDEVHRETGSGYACSNLLFKAQQHYAEEGLCYLYGLITLQRCPPGIAVVFAKWSLLI